MNVVGLSLVLFLATPVWAHDKSLHEGKGTRGRIETVTADRVTLRTDAGTVVVTLNDATKVEHDENVVARDTLRPGAQVAVFGTKLPGGEVVAKEILLETEAEPAKRHDGHSHGE